MAPMESLLLLQSLRPLQAESRRDLFMLPVIRTFHFGSRIARSLLKGLCVSPSLRMLNQILGGMGVVEVGRVRIVVVEEEKRWE
jgi:hypothetical protein